MAASSNFMLPSRFGSRCSDRVMMHVVRPTNARDIMEYGFQDLSRNHHTDVVLIAEGSQQIRVHSFLLSSVSSYLDTLLNSSHQIHLKNVICLPEVEFPTVYALCQLLYGSAVVLGGAEIVKLNQLIEQLGILIHVSILEPGNLTGLQALQQSVSPVPRGQGGGGDLSEGSVQEEGQRTIIGQVQITRRRGLSTLSKGSRVAFQKAGLREMPLAEPSNTLMPVSASALSADLTEPPLSVEQIIVPPIETRLDQSEDSCLFRISRSFDDFANMEITESDSISHVTQLPPNLTNDNLVCQGAAVMVNNKARHLSVIDNLAQHCSTYDNIHSNMATIDSLQQIDATSESKNPQFDPDEESILPDLRQPAPPVSGSITVSEETVNTSEKELPLLCWHCNNEFSSFDLLSAHMDTHTTIGKFSRRHHRCPRCGEVLPSMWKLRQHLSKHQALKLDGKGDHPYAERTRRSKNIRKQKGDHGYANADCKQPEPVPLSEPNFDPAAQREFSSEPVLASEPVLKTRKRGRKKATTVSNEHSYVTKRDSSPEHDQTDVEEKQDHPYSAVKVDPPHPLSEVGPVSMEAALTVDLGDPVANSSSRYLQQPADVTEQSAVESVLSADAAVHSADPVHSYAVLNSCKRLSPRLPKHKVKADVFHCEFCTKYFPAAYRLNRHIREVHHKEKSHKCDLCEAEFFKSTSLLRHKVGVHSQLRPYVCSHCSFGFKDSTALRYHVSYRVCKKQA